ncbi:ABC transporter permease [Thermostilla marina]
MPNLLGNTTRPMRPVAGWSSRIFAGTVIGFVAVFVLGWALLIQADIGYTQPDSLRVVFTAPEIRAAAWLSVWTSVLTTVIGLVFAVPIGYALSRYRLPLHAVIDSIVDLPILMPPLIVGLSLLVFFQTDFGRTLEDWGLKFVFQKRGIVLCQFLASASFGIRAMKICFDGIDPRLEHVAMTLGSTRAHAFFSVALPLAWRGVIAAGILIWTRAFGIFGPLMVFVGAVRMRTEVLPTTIYLEQSVGRIEVALAVALVMLALAAAGLIVVRVIGMRSETA